ncbi:MAG: hypothetical protein H0X41_03740 [Chitinophagaceae bacterium]|nr:hypothetical protein [Chitinophagaceae bacterium]
MNPSFEKISYCGWTDCIRLLCNGIEMIVATTFGPRILYFGFAGQENLLHLEHDQLGLTGGEDWRIYGGHRLWHAPEAMPRTYSPDNDPVEVRIIAYGVRLIQQTEASTRIQKEVDITFLPNHCGVKVLHRLRNEGLWDVELAPWALSTLSGSGTLIIPQEPYGPADTSLLPVRAVAMWPFTKLHDPRWKWSDKFLLAVFDADMHSEQKLGITNTAGWMAYSLNGQVLIKSFPYDPAHTYPDLGCNAEVYIDGRFIEMETLGAQRMLKRGNTTEHIEYWALEKLSLTPDDASIGSQLLPRVHALQKAVRQ